MTSNNFKEFPYSDSDEEFWGVGGKSAYLIKLKEKVKEGMELGVEFGWWPSYDKNTLTPNAPSKIFYIEDFPENATMGHVMAEAGIFPSVTIARKNGWNIPIDVGDYVVTKKKILIRVV